MSFNKVVDISKKHFPDLQIKYKNESKFMIFLGKLLFFNKDFMENFTTTIGSTVYFPNEKFTKTHQVSSAMILLHELVHIYDAQKYSKILFSFLYLSPQILFLLFFPLLLISWKIALLCLILLLPIPAYFRMHFEKRAYLVSLYVMYKHSLINNYSIDLDEQKESFLKQFKNSSYYFMWPFPDLDLLFNIGLLKIKSNQKPYEDKIFEILDDIIVKSND